MSLTLGRILKGFPPGVKSLRSYQIRTSLRIGAAGMAATDRTTLMLMDRYRKATDTKLNIAG